MVIKRLVPNKLSRKEAKNRNYVKLFLKIMTNIYIENGHKNTQPTSQIPTIFSLYCDFLLKRREKMLKTEQKS